MTVITTFEWTSDRTKTERVFIFIGAPLLKKKMRFFFAWMQLSFNKDGAKVHKFSERMLMLRFSFLWS